MPNHNDRIEKLKAQIEDLHKRWPAHSVPPAMMQEMDELEEQLKNELADQEQDAKEAGDNPQRFHFQPIGYVENEHDFPSDHFRDTAESRLHIDPSLAAGLEGLSVGQQIMVIFYFHHSKGFSLLQHPQGDQSRAKRGVFAICSPYRPNPIGVTVVTLIGIEGNVLRVRGLDACNGTPILDLKPAYK